MKKLLFYFLIFSLITSPAYASEVIDVFEEYASCKDFVLKTYSFSIDTSKNENVSGKFFTECSAPHKIHITSEPSFGDVFVEDNRFIYTPAKNYIGEDHFQYRIYANGAYSNISRCSINVSGAKIPDTKFCYEDMKNHPSKNIAEKLVEMNIIKGERIADKYYFHPNTPLTRASAISYLCAALGTDSDEKNTPVIFADNDKLSPKLQEDAFACYSSGILEGKPVGQNINLCPDEPLTRAEMFSMIDRALAGKTHSKITLDFPDSKSIPDYARLNVKNLVANNFIENSKSELLRPNDIATKTEFAELLYKLISANEESITKTLSQRIKEGFYANLIT